MKIFAPNQCYQSIILNLLYHFRTFQAEYFFRLLFAYCGYKIQAAVVEKVKIHPGGKLDTHTASVRPKSIECESRVNE